MVVGEVSEAHMSLRETLATSQEGTPPARQIFHFAHSRNFLKIISRARIF